MKNIYDEENRLCLEDSMARAEIRCRVTGRPIRFRDVYAFWRAKGLHTKFLYGMAFPCGCILIYRWVGQPKPKTIAEMFDGGFTPCHYHLSKSKKYTTLERLIVHVVQCLYEIKYNSKEGR